MSSMSRRLMKSPAVPLPWKMAGPDPLETTIPQPALSHGGPRFKRPALFEIGHQFLSTSSIPRDFFCLNGYRNFYLGIQEVNSVGLIWFLCIFAKLCPMFDSEDPSKIGWDWKTTAFPHLKLVPLQGAYVLISFKYVFFFSSKLM